MNCRIIEMRNKEVINIKDGCRVGCVCDVEIDTCSAKMTAIVVPGRLKWCGLLGREEDIVIPWKDIEVIGEDTILVSYHMPHRKRSKANRLMQNLLIKSA